MNSAGKLDPQNLFSMPNGRAMQQKVTRMYSVSRKCRGNYFNLPKK